MLSVRYPICMSLWTETDSNYRHEALQTPCSTSWVIDPFIVAGEGLEPASFSLWDWAGTSSSPPRDIFLEEMADSNHIYLSTRNTPCPVISRHSFILYCPCGFEPPLPKSESSVLTDYTKGQLRYRSWKIQTSPIRFKIWYTNPLY